MFQANIASWTEEAQVEETNEYKSLDIERLFAKAVQKPQESAEPESTAEPEGTEAQ